MIYFAEFRRNGPILSDYFIRIIIFRSEIHVFQKIRVDILQDV